MDAEKETSASGMGKEEKTKHNAETMESDVRGASAGQEHGTRARCKAGGRGDEPAERERQASRERSEPQEHTGATRARLEPQGDSAGDEENCAVLTPSNGKRPQARCWPG